MIDITNTIPPGNYSKIRLDKSTGKHYQPEAIVLHITGDSSKSQTVDWFQNSESKVSAHYVIEKDGTVAMCVYPACKAYHCGIVDHPHAQIYFDKGKVNPNLYTIGIECVSSGEILTDAQYKSLFLLVKDLCDAFRIPKDRYHIIGHYELDCINRSYDPVSSYSVDYVIKGLEAMNNMSNAIPPAVTLDDAIKILVQEAVLNSPDYRAKVCDVVNYEKEFTIAAANKIIEYKNKLAAAQF